MKGVPKSCVIDSKLNDRVINSASKNLVSYMPGLIWSHILKRTPIFEWFLPLTLVVKLAMTISVIR